MVDEVEVFEDGEVYALGLDVECAFFLEDYCGVYAWDLADYG